MKLNRSIVSSSTYVSFTPKEEFVLKFKIFLIENWESNLMQESRFEKIRYRWWKFKYADINEWYLNVLQCRLLKYLNFEEMCNLSFVNILIITNCYCVMKHTARIEYSMQRLFRCVEKLIRTLQSASGGEEKLSSLASSSFVFFFQRTHIITDIMIWTWSNYLIKLRIFSWLFFLYIFIYCRHIAVGRKFHSFLSCFMSG